MVLKCIYSSLNGPNQWYLGWRPTWELIRMQILESETLVVGPRNSFINLCFIFISMHNEV